MDTTTEEVARTSPYAARAPEAWRGIPRVPSSDVWSFAATLLNWAKADVVGRSNAKDPTSAAMWSLASLMRLFPNGIAPPVEGAEHLQGVHDLAKVLAQAPNFERPGEMYLNTGTLEEELATADVSPELANFFRYLLVVDHEKRPTAAEALSSKEFEALGP